MGKVSKGIFIDVIMSKICDPYTKDSKVAEIVQKGLNKLSREEVASLYLMVWTSIDRKLNRARLDAVAETVRSHCKRVVKSVDLKSKGAKELVIDLTSGKM